LLQKKYLTKKIKKQQPINLKYQKKRLPTISKYLKLCHFRPNNRFRFRKNFNKKNFNKRYVSGNSIKAKYLANKNFIEKIFYNRSIPFKYKKNYVKNFNELNKLTKSYVQISLNKNVKGFNYFALNSSFNANLKLLILKKKLEFKLKKYNIKKNIQFKNINWILKGFKLDKLKKRVLDIISRNTFYSKKIADLVHLSFISFIYNDLYFLNYYISSYLKKNRNHYKIIKELSVLYNCIYKQTNLFSGLNISIKGRLNNSDRTKKISILVGKSIQKNSISCKLNYSFNHVFTLYGTFGLRVWYLR